MVINSIQVGMKQSRVALFALLTAPVELLAESKSLSLTEVSLGIASSRSRWQRLDALIAIPWKESQACS